MRIRHPNRIGLSSFIVRDETHLRETRVVGQRLPPQPALLRPPHTPRSMPARVRSDSVRVSSPAHAIVMWNMASPIGVVVVVDPGSRRLRRSPMSWLAFAEAPDDVRGAARPAGAFGPIALSGLTGSK